MTIVDRWVQEVDPKRSGDKVPVQFDWHDYLADVWAPGITVPAGRRFRFHRRDPRSTGLEYEVTVAGRTGGRVPMFPTAIGQAVVDGSATLTARAMTAGSLRGTIGTSSFPSVDGVTLSGEINEDLVYTIWVAGGVDGQTYEILHNVTLNGVVGEVKGAVALLPVVG